MSTTPIKVGVREFRTRIAEYMEATAPIAVTRHGEIIGYYIPAKPAPKASQMKALKKAATEFHKSLAEHNITLNEDEIIAEFREMRAKDRAKDKE